MISIGIRPPEEELFGKMPVEPISTVVEGVPVMYLNGIDKTTRKAKINRIILSRTAIVEFLRVESPSKIWVRLLNHITNTTLTIEKETEVKRKLNISVGDYALAPSDEKSLRRCRIEEIAIRKSGEQSVKIFFIDDAVTLWVAPECLAELDEYYMFFPWQAIQISMFSLFPGISENKDSYKWTCETCDELQNILKSFKYLKLEVVLSSIAYNDYARSIPCNIYGTNKEPDDPNLQEASIIDIILSNGNLPIFRLPLYDAARQQFFECENEKGCQETINDIHTKIPELFKILKSDEDESSEIEKKNLSDDLEWDPKYCKVPIFSKNDFKKYVDPLTGNIMLCVEGIHTKSPYEWYARPIQRTWLSKKDGEIVTMENRSKYSGDELQETDEVHWMLYGNDDLVNASECLDMFYSNENNRKPFLKDEISKLLENQKVYAICAVNEERSKYTGEWQRVEILKCDTFAFVRFLDSGGTDMVLTSSLYLIHEQHCRYPPKCLSFVLHGVCFPNNRWESKEVSKFKMLLREDVPIFININNVKLLHENSRTTVAKKFGTTSPPILPLYDHFFYVRNVLISKENKSLETHFVQTTNAIQNDSLPFIWEN